MRVWLHFTLTQALNKGTIQDITALALAGSRARAEAGFGFRVCARPSSEVLGGARLMLS